jgi:tetratricopeptide (TPR) repeat protein
MKRLFSFIIDQVSDPLLSAEAVRLATLGLIRMMTQHAIVVLAEWLAVQPKHLERSCTEFTKVAGATNGTLAELLGSYLIMAEHAGWNNVSGTLYDRMRATDEVSRMVQRRDPNLDDLLRAIAWSRNEGAEGHGLPGNYIRDLDLELLRITFERLMQILPDIQDSGDNLVFTRNNLEAPLPIKTLRLDDGHPVLVRKLVVVRAGVLRVEGQVWLSTTSKRDTNFEVMDIRAALPAGIRPTYSAEYQAVSFVYLPERLAASEEFTGRRKELQELTDWADDEDSRACLVYGDGGIGKTTLVLEFAHRLLEGRLPDVVWQPDIITFFSAKKTRWGIGGLERLSAENIGVVDLVRHMAMLLGPRELDPHWYKGDVGAAIDRLAGLLGEWRVNRKSHLIILDNTETMIESVAERQNLATGIRLLARKIGRVLVTSRRAEVIEAQPIQIEPWSDDECADYLKKRGSALQCEPINRSGLASLRGYGRRLGNKPIILEAFVQATKVRGSVEAGFLYVQNLQREDLGAFLYEDAWGRFSDEIKCLLLLMTRVADLHDHISLGLCCERVGVTVMNAEEAIRESRGIASHATYLGRPEIVFYPEFMRFCQDRTIEVEGVPRPKSDEASLIHNAYRETVKAQAPRSGEWSLIALRSRYARQAWRHFEAKERDEAIKSFNKAIEDDGDNGLLRAQFAFALWRYTMYVEALEQVNLAIKLEAENPECWFIKSKVEIDRGDTYSAMATIQRAEELGKNRYLCDLLRARALVFWKDSIRIKTVEHAIYTTDENGKPVTIPERIEEEVITKEMPERKRQARKLLAGVTKSGVLEGTDLVEVRRLEEELSSMKYSEI